jgi:hypothetical protein
MTGDLVTSPGRRELEGFIDVNVALRHASGGMSKQCGNRQFGKSEVPGDAAECVPKCAA